MAQIGPGGQIQGQKGPASVTSSPPENVFDLFETVPPLLAFIHKHVGADGLRQLLAMETKGHTKENLRGYADELRAMKLTEPARIVRAAAKRAPSEMDLCPWPAGSANARAWSATMLRRRVKS
jgi:hypothetical protein